MNHEDRKIREDKWVFMRKITLKIQRPTKKGMSKERRKMRGKKKRRNRIVKSYILLSD